MRIATTILLAMLCIMVESRAAEPWPAEAWDAATLLTSLDSDFDDNMSGAGYNPETQTFWVCCNGMPSAFWALDKKEDGSWGIATKEGKQAKYNLERGDLEGICQVDYGADQVCLMFEGEDRIRMYDTSEFGAATLRHEWDISAYVPTLGGNGSEGITFVPDEWLAKGGFTDAEGNAYTSRNGMGGLMFVAHQNGGRIYVFDLGVDSKDVRFVGAYRSSREESSGLEFDRSSGRLYIWHNTGPNYLEVTELSSVGEGDERRLLTVKEFLGPKAGNLEGIAVSPEAAGDHLCLIVDDDNQDDAAVMLFTRFDAAAAGSGTEKADAPESSPEKE